MPRRKNKRSRQSLASKIPCKYCGISVVELLECSTCNRKLYCSVECQLGDQKNHKNDCDGRTSEQKMRKPSETSYKHQVSSVSPSPKKAEECDCCGKSGVKLQRCSRCHKVKYCSKKCQKADWPNHKVDCEENGKIPAGTFAKNSAEECDCCGKSGVKLQKCSRCHEVKYCSKKCQKADWPNHKVDCEENGKIPASTSAKNSESICPACWSVCKNTYCDTCVMRRVFSEINLTCDLKKNCQRVRDLYPDFEVITKFRHIENSPLFPFIRFKQVLLARMFRRGHHLFRPSMNLIDEDGTEFCLMFYLDDPEKHQRFPWHRFIPDNYICIPFPRCHFFMDGSIGFRVEDTADVRILGNSSADES